MMGPLFSFRIITDIFHILSGENVGEWEREELLLWKK